MFKFLYTAISLPLIIAISSCGGKSSTPTDGETPPAILTLEFQFASADSGWQIGYADYPVGDDEFYELQSAFEQLPSPLDDLAGLKVSGNNHSDDLFMFIKKNYSGFEANTAYKIQFEITFASNAPSGCAGVGGAPGESVYIKGGATIIEPLAINDGASFYVMNIDKANQSNSGSDAIVLGDFANSKDCEDGDFSYELKTIINDENDFSVTTGPDARLWFLFATDSGFEATTSIYYVMGKIIATRI